MAGKSRYEIIIIGCGIAGASLSYFLARRGMGDVLILEREEQPGYHATGRAAGVLAELDFIPTTQVLKLMSAGFLRTPPEGFSEHPILCQSGILVMFQGELWEAAHQMVPQLRNAGATVDVLSQKEVISRMPVFSPDNFDGALSFPKDGHLDVNGLLWSYLRHARQRGVQLHLSEGAKGIKVEKGRCCGVITDRAEYQCRWVVNAAGAWSGKIRGLIGGSPVALTPLRRTIITFEAPEDLDVKDWPFAVDINHALYVSPESSGLLASPMDEEPVEPCDARPDELTIARTIERLRQLAPRLVPRSITHKWAGLRTFSPDQAMVVGEDPTIKGFFWLSGQGGSGIETSPVIGQIATDLIVDGRTEMMDMAPLSPHRFGGGG